MFLGRKRLLHCRGRFLFDVLEVRLLHCRGRFLFDVLKRLLHCRGRFLFDVLVVHQHDDCFPRDENNNVVRCCRRVTPGGSALVRSLGLWRRNRANVGAGQGEGRFHVVRTQRWTKGHRMGQGKNRVGELVVEPSHQTRQLKCVFGRHVVAFDVRDHAGAADHATISGTCSRDCNCITISSGEDNVRK